MALVNTDFTPADNSIVNNMALTLKWEKAFAGYVNGLDQKNVALIDQSIAAMKEVDPELTLKIWMQDILEVRQWRKEQDLLEELKSEGRVFFRSYVAAVKFKKHCEKKFINLSIKSYYGRNFECVIQRQ
ncbi:hypothetical protein ABEP12_01900 [Bacillus velezensis]